MKTWNANVQVLKVIATAVVVATIVGGCASKEVAPQVGDQLVPLRNQADQIEAQINSTGAAATALLAAQGPDITQQIDTLDDEVQKLRQTLSVGKSEVDSADAAAAEYFAQWDDQLETMSDDLSRSGAVRREQAMTSFGNLRTDIGTFGEQARAYVADLDESVRYLRTDKTMAGLKTVTSKIRSALARQPSMQNQLDKLQSSIDKIRGV